MALTTAVLLLAGCAGSDDGVGAPAVVFGDVPVSFSTGVSVTRATIDNTESLKALSQGFGVLGYLTDTETWDKATGGKALSAFPPPDYMYNQQVRWAKQYDTGTKDKDGNPIYGYDWVYSPLKYWPNSDSNATARYISFFAYAPFVEQAAMGTTGITAMTNGDDHRPYLVYQLDTEKGSVQSDLLWAKCEDATRNGEGLIYFEGSTEKWQKVPLEFRHALAAVEVYVQRVYDEQTSSGHKPAGDHTRLFVSELQLSATNTATAGLYASGRLDLQTGTWSSPDGAASWPTGDATQSVTLTYGEALLNDTVGGTTQTTLAVIANQELNKWDKGFGVDEEERLLFKDKAITLLPSGGEVTITPTLTYSMVTQDNEQQLSTLTDSKGNKYTRLVNKVTGNPLTLKLEDGKKYKLVIRIGVEHVAFGGLSVVDWDFPMRFNPGVGADFEDDKINHTLNEEDK